MFQSCSVLDMEIPFTPEEIERAIVETVSHNGHAACYVRPLVFRGAGPLGVLPKGNPIQVMIATWEWDSLHGAGSVENGVDVGFSSWRRMAPGTHPSMAKASGNYLNSQLVVQEAIRHGYSEGLVLDVDGYLSEGSGENVFLMQDGKLLTLPVGNSILAGITRGMVVDLCGELDPAEGGADPSRDGALLRRDVHDRHRRRDHPRAQRGRDGLPGRAPGPVTKRLQDEFFAIVKGESPDRHGWLTHVAEASS